MLGWLRSLRDEGVDDIMSADYSTKIAKIQDMGASVWINVGGCGYIIIITIFKCLY